MNSEKEYTDTTGLEIAVIGMAGRFPGADNIDRFWHNLKNGVESIAYFSEEELAGSGVDHLFIKDANYVKAGGALDGIDRFDASFFGFTPVDAKVTDPQVRLFLECCWQALEDAGYDPGSYSGLIGLYAGASDNIPWKVQHILSDEDNPDRFLASLLQSKDFMSLLVSYKLDLKGPSFTMYTACSSSLTAIHLACQALLNGECDMALAGGVTIYIPNRTGYLYQENMIFSPDGHNRTFDARARGTIFGSGVGAVMLKRLEEAIAERDHIYAVIKGSAINNDGLRKVGFTAPSIDGQAEVIRTAQQMARVEAESISCIEAHGTATELGDPVEIEALTMAFNTGKKNFCAIGSVKSNVGHLDSAAGVTGFIKTVLALKHRLIPPSLHFESPNPRIDFENSPFYVNREAKEWQQEGAGQRAAPLRAGVSSFGIGGTNAHVILEEWDEAGYPAQDADRFPQQLLLLSARTPTALDRLTADLAQRLQDNPDINIADTAYTLALGRKKFKYRRVLVCASREEAAGILSDPKAAGVQTTVPEDEERPLVFMFSGQGSQYVYMAVSLYKHEPLYRRAVDECCHILETRWGYDIKEMLYPGEAGSDLSHEEAKKRMDDVLYSGPVKFTFEYALAKLVMSWGFTPTAMIGHSFGEYAAAHLAGVFSLEDALQLVVLRGKLMQKTPPGAMMSVPLPVEELKGVLHEKISLAAVNTDSLCIVSGPLAEVDALEQELKEKGHECLRINFPRASHSKLMRSVAKEFEAAVAKVTLHEPKIPYIAGLSGDWQTPAEAVNPGYWARHLTNTVQFLAGIKKLSENRDPIFVQVGCDRGLPLFVGQYQGIPAEDAAVNLVRHPKDDVSDIHYILNALGRLWLLGYRADWREFYNRRAGRRISLPGYPFEREHYSVRGDLLRKGLEMMGKLEASGGGERTDNGQPSEGESLAERETVPGTGAVLADLKPRPHMKSAYAPPGSELEQRLCDIWTKMFGFGQIGVADDFYELGGDSTKAILLTSQVNQIGCHVTLADVLANPTIKELAAFISESTAGEDLEEEIYERRMLAELACLVKLNRGRNRQNVFFIHDNEGRVECGSELALLLDTNFNVYGLQARGVDNDTKPADSPWQMVDDYLEQITTFQPDGPYLIGGFSNGSIVAYEIALRLEQRNRRVERLILLDASSLFISRGFLRKRRVGRLPGFIKRAQLAAQKKEFQRELQAGKDRVGKQMSLLPRYSLSFEIVNAPLLVTVTRDVQHPAAARKSVAKMTKSDAAFIEIPADRNAVLERPHVERLAEAIKESLSRFDEKYEK